MREGTAESRVAREEEMETTEIAGAALEPLRTLVVGMHTLATAFPEDAARGHPLEWRGLWYEETEELARGVYALASALVSHVLGESDARRTETLSSATAAVADARERLAAELNAERPVDFEAEEDVGELLREVGLEAHDRSIIFGREGGEHGTPVFVHRAVPAATAHVWLLGRLYERMESWLLDDPLLALERRASSWWFERWTMSEKAAKRMGAEFGNYVREQEWSLVERPTLSVPASVNILFCEDLAFAECPTRLRHLARGLRASFAGVFVIRRRNGDRLTLEGLEDGRHYDVHEHNPSVDFAPGQLMLGRLIPFEPRLYLRSPGMVGMDARRGKELDTLWNGLDVMRDQFSPAIAVETMVTTLTERKRPPRTVRPAASRADAGELLDLLRKELDHAELGESRPLSELPDEVREQGEGREYRTYELDSATAEWMDALTRYAKRSGKRNTR